VSTVLLGASKLEQLAHNLDALDLLPSLDEETRRRIEAAVG
jgi:aryl-alcohol dehydrogenase-like predicted oxidoreductase